MIISGEENKFIASQDLEVYISAEKFNQNEYCIEQNKYANYTYLELNTLITQEIISENFNNYKEEITYEIAYNSGSKGDLKAIIPKGTTYYISDDLYEIIPELFYVTEEINNSEETDISELYKYGVDVCTKNGERHKVTSKEYNKDDVIGIFVDDNTVMSIKRTKIILQKINLDKYYKNNPEKDNNGYENTQLLKKYNENIKKLCKDDLYIPSVGELLEVYKNLFKINLTLKYLEENLITDFGRSFLSSNLKDNNRYWGIYINQNVNIQYEYIEIPTKKNEITTTTNLFINV